VCNHFCAASSYAVVGEYLLAELACDAGSRPTNSICLFLPAHAYFPAFHTTHSSSSGAAYYVAEQGDDYSYLGLLDDGDMEEYAEGAMDAQQAHGRFVLAWFVALCV
jgi:hypothetical protein